MPGLHAIVDFAAGADHTAPFRRQGAALMLHPWYMHDGWADPEGRAWLGRVDLGVFNAGPQPVVSQDGRYVLCLQGELYDRAERLDAIAKRGMPLTGRDNADLLLAVYRAEGLSGVEKLNGNFFFLLWDAHDGVLTAGGDRYGNRPHFYHFHEGRFYLAPSVAGVVAARGSTPAPSLAGIGTFLAMEHPFDDLTPFEDIRCFPPGTFLTLSTRGAEWRRYWMPAYTGPAERRVRPESEWLDEATALFRQAIARTMQDQSRFCVPLSGGSDSRTIVALAGRNDFPVYTFGDPASDDVIYARRMADTLGLSHHFQPLSDDYLASQAEPMIRTGEGMVSLFHGHNCSDAAWTRELAPVVIYGMTAEFFRLELMEYVLAERPRSALHRAGLLVRHAADGRRPLARFGSDAEFIEHLLGYYWGIVNPQLANQVLAPELASRMGTALRGGFERVFAEIPGNSWEDRLSTFNVWSRQRRFSVAGLKQANAYTEFRKPFDDYDLVDFMLTLPPATRRRVQVAVLSRTHPAIAAIPRTGTGLPVNAGYAQRAVGFARKEIDKALHPGRKQTFADPNAALRTHARAFYEELLLDPATRANGLFDGAGLEKLVRAHMDGHVDAASPLLALATVELWRRRYAKGVPALDRAA